MKFDCIVIRRSTVPFIHPVDSDTSPFTIVDDEKMTHEQFTIQKFETDEPSSGRPALYLVANKLKWSREKVIQEILRLNPRPFKYFD